MNQFLENFCQKHETVNLGLKTEDTQGRNLTACWYFHFTMCLRKLLDQSAFSHMDLCLFAVIMRSRRPPTPNHFVSLVDRQADSKMDWLTVTL